MEHSLFYTQFSPLNAGNRLLALCHFENSLGEHAPRHPLKTWTVDTVGYSTEICWLLQFLLKHPLSRSKNLMSAQHA